MLMINGENGEVKIRSSITDFIFEMAMAIHAINKELDEKPTIIRESMEESLVTLDDCYSEICKFSVRMNEAKKRVEKMKEKNPEYFDENGMMNNKILEESLSDILKKLIDEMK